MKHPNSGPVVLVFLIVILSGTVLLTYPIGWWAVLLGCLGVCTLAHLAVKALVNDVSSRVYFKSQEDAQRAINDYYKSIIYNPYGWVHPDEPNTLVQMSDIKKAGYLPLYKLTANAENGK